MQYIRRLHPETDEDKKTLVKGTLEGLLIKCQQNSYDRSLTLATLELMLAMLEQGDQYPAVIEYLKATSLPFLQKAYLQHETITEIVEASTLILSRINIAFTNI